MKRVVCICKRSIDLGFFEPGKVYEVQEEYLYSADDNTPMYRIHNEPWMAMRFKVVRCPCNIDRCIEHRKEQ